MPPRIHVSYDFAQMTDDQLPPFTLGVEGGLTGNLNYTSPPSVPSLTAARDAFETALTAAADGGKMETQIKNDRRGDLIALLYTFAEYVQEKCGQDKAKLLSSGFHAASQERRREPLSKPTSVAVKPGEMDGQLIGAVKPPIKNTSLYEGRAQAEGTTVWLPSVFTGDSRRIEFNALTSGTMYTIQVRALGGSTRYSEWSDPVMHRAP